MVTLSKKTFFYIFSVMFVTVALTRIITRNSGFPSSVSDSTAVILILDVGLFAIIFFVVAVLLEKTGFYKDKNKISDRQS